MLPAFPIFRKTRLAAESSKGVVETAGVATGVATGAAAGAAATGGAEATTAGAEAAAAGAGANILVTVACFSAASCASIFAMYASMVSLG